MGNSNQNSLDTVLGSENIEYMSQEGYKKLSNELEKLKTEERIHIAERLEYAKSLGDLSENAEFDAAKEEQMLNEMRIREIEDIISRVSILSKGDVGSTVSIGSSVIVSFGSSKTQETYTIVGSSEEANPVSGYISHESPLGRAFIGRKKGEKIVVSTPRGDSEYVIVKIA